MYISEFKSWFDPHSKIFIHVYHTGSMTESFKEKRYHALLSVNMDVSHGRKGFNGEVYTIASTSCSLWEFFVAGIQL